MFLKSMLKIGIYMNDSNVVNFARPMAYSNNHSVFSDSEAEGIAEVADHNSRVVNSVETLPFMESLQKQGAFYDVKVVDNCYPNGAIDQNGSEIYLPTGKKTLINGDTGAPLSVMSQSYKVVTNLEIFEAMFRQIEASGLDTTGMLTKVEIANEGAQVAVQIILPAYSVDAGNGDITSLMFTAINSFNGSTSFCIYAGGFRSFCFNSQVFGTTIVQYRAQHCANLNIETAARIMRSGMDVFQLEGEVWKRMANTQVSGSQAYFALADLAENVDVVKYPSFEVYNREVCAYQARTTKLENYKRIFEKYVREMGNSEFALYNAMTHISSHGAAASGDKAQSVSTFETRNKRIARLAPKHLTAYALTA